MLSRGTVFTGHYLGIAQRSEEQERTAVHWPEVIDTMLLTPDLVDHVRVFLAGEITNNTIGVWLLLLLGEQSIDGSPAPTFCHDGNLR